MRFSLTASAIAAISLASYAAADPMKAVAYVSGFAPAVFGTVYFTQDTPDSPTMIRANISGLTYGKHGIHIHQYGDLSNGCTTTGAHYNPFNMNHGGPQDSNRHVGDFGNIDVAVERYSTLELSSDLVKLSGENSVIGRGVVVHSGEDDLGKGDSPLSSTTGNAGDRWACGVIGYAST